MDQMTQCESLLYKGNAAMKNNTYLRSRILKLTVTRPVHKIVW